MLVPEVIERAVYYVLVTKYWKVASLTILLYDYLLTFDREVQLIWKSSWGIGKILFLCARYSPLIDVPLSLWVFFSPHISVQECMRFFSVPIWITVFGLASAEAILFVRTSALYNNTKIVTFTLCSIWASAIITAIVVVALYIRSFTFHSYPLPTLTGCHPTVGKKIIYGAFVVLLVQETIVVAFTLYRAMQTGIRTKDRLMQTLYRDGLLYYLFLLVIGVGNILVMTIGPRQLLVMTQVFQRVMHAILSTRVLLNARGVARDREVMMSDLQSIFTSFIQGTVSIPEEFPEQQSSTHR